MIQNISTRQKQYNIKDIDKINANHNITNYNIKIMLSKIYRMKIYKKKNCMKQQYCEQRIEKYIARERLDNGSPLSFSLYMMHNPLRLLLSVSVSYFTISYSDRGNVNPVHDVYKIIIYK